MSYRYPLGAITKAIDALELAYSYLRDEPVVARELLDALQRLYRAQELHEEARAKKRGARPQQGGGE